MVDDNPNDSLVGKDNQKIDDLRQFMDAMFSFASQVPNKNDHPLQVIHASKSLIGMSLDHPPRNLLKWLDDYVKDFIPNFNPPAKSDNNLFPETITYTHLEKLILNKEESESNIYLTHLLQVADPLHIAEFLIEVGAQKSPGSFLFCWSAYRTIQLLGEKNGHSILYHCIPKLLAMQETENNNEKLLFDQVELYCHQFQIRKTEMVRKNKIIPHLDIMIQRIERELNCTSQPIIPIALGSAIKKDGDRGIISYLSNLKIEDISVDLILIIDALRSALKFSDNLKDPVLLHIINNTIETEHVK